MTEALKREKWIVISHAFNMDGRAASQTITDKIPFFLEKGVEPVVISAVTGRKDEVVEHHQLLPWAPSGLKFDMRHWVKLNIKNKGLQKVVKALFSLLLLPFYVVERLLLPLETHWSWFMPSALKAVVLARRHKARIIFSTGGANSAHLAGYLAAKWTGLPWIVEVHDPMVYEGMNISWMRYRWSAWLEGIICRHCHRAWWFTTNALDRARARHPQLGPKGFLVIPGAEEPDFKDVVYHKTDKFCLGHFGSLDPQRNLSVFIEAMSILAKSNPQFAQMAELHVYGNNLDDVSVQAVERFNLKNIIVCHGRLETDPLTGKSGRQRVIETMRNTDVLVLLHGEGPFCEEYIPSKLYEYLWTRRPILGLVRNNAMLENMLKQMECSSVYADDADAASQQIENYFLKWKLQGIPDRTTPSPYTTCSAVDTIISTISKSL